MVSRRRMLALTAGAALGTAGASALGASASSAAASDVAKMAERVARPKPVPQTLARTRTVHSGQLSVTDTDFALTHLGLVWQGQRPHVRIRTRTGWGGWKMVDGCGGAPDGRTANGTVLVASDAVAYQVGVAGRSTVRVTEMNTVDGPTVAEAAAVQSSMPLPGGGRVAVPYLTRAAWGANENLRFKNGAEFWPAEYIPVQTLTVHHTATGVDPDPSATVRAIYYNQCISKDWGDIGYHLMIDASGRVYECRVSGADGLPVFGGDPGADGRPQMVNGGHVLHYNAGNIGVCLLGDFMTKLPTTAAMLSLQRVLTGLARVTKLNAGGTTNFVSAVDSQYTKTVRTISGHRNWAATDCPGDKFYPQLATVRSQVAFLTQSRTPGRHRAGTTAATGARRL
jgi:hypothetical protein